MSRRCIGVGLVVGLVLGVLPVAPVGAAGQPAERIKLEFVDGGSAPSAVTGVSEEGGAQTVRVAARAKAPGAAVDVYVTVAAGTASAADYAVDRTAVVVKIPAGQEVGYSPVLTVTPVDDTRVEGDETIVFSGSTSAVGYAAVADVSLNIVDDDDAIVLSLDKSAVLEWEGDQTVVVTAAFAGAAESDLAAASEVVVSVAGGAGEDGATAGSAGPPRTGDFSTDQAGGSFTVSIGAGEVSGSSSFNLAAHVDSVVEVGGEKVVVSGVSSGFSVAGAELTIHDPVVSLGFTDAGDPPVAVTGLGEDGGAQTVRAAASVPAPAPEGIDVTVTVADTGSTAAAGAGGDYTTTGVPASMTVSIRSGEMSGSSGDLVFDPLPDRVFEDHEVIEFTGAASGYTVEDADLLILDADRTLVVSVNPGWLAGTRIGAKIAAGEPLIMHEPGDPSIPDTQGGAQAPANRRYGRPGLTIKVDEVTSSTYSEKLRLRFRVWDWTANLGGLVGNRDVYTELHRSVNYNAGDGGDHQSLGFDVTSIPVGSLFTSRNYRDYWHAWQDNAAEADEIFTYGVEVIGVTPGAAPPEGFTVNRLEALVIDDDVQIDLDRDVASVAEGSSGTDVKISAGMAASSSQLTADTVVSLSVIEEDDPGPGFLSADEFSFAWTRRSITVPAGDVNDGGWQTTLEGLSIADDTVVEGPERLRIVGKPALSDGNPDGQTVTLTDNQVVTFRDALAHVMVTDDDADIALSVSPESVGEKAGGQSVTVVAEFAGSSSVLTSDTEVVVQVAGGTADLGTDFTVSGLDSDNRLRVRIPAGRTSGSKTFTLTAPDDGAVESGGETVTFAGHGTTRVGGQEVTVTGGVLTIVDPGSEVVLSLTDAGASPAALSAVGEDDGAQTVRVTAAVAAALSGSDLEVAVTVGALGDTADAGDDYTVDESSVTVTIADGAATGTAEVTVTPVSDTVTEDHETIRFTGTAAGHVVVPASLEITDADRMITLEMNDAVYAEGIGLGSINRMVTARLSGESSTYSGNIAGRLISETGTAGDPGDYSSNINRLTYSWLYHRYISINPGNIAGNTSFLSSIKADPVAEPEEDFYLTLSGLTAGFTVERVRATIVDRVDTAVELTPGGTVLEGGDGSSLSVRAKFPFGVTWNTGSSDFRGE